MLKKQLKRSARYNEDGSLPELIGKDLQRNLDNVDTKLEEVDSVNEADEEITEEPAEDLEDDAEAPEDGEENPEDEVPDHLETDLEEPEETFKDINEKVVVYLYRGFAEIGDQVRLFVEDTDNEERDPELVETLQDFMEGFPEVMDVVKELAKKYVTSVDLYDTEEEEEITDEEPAEDLEDDAEAPEEDAEAKETVESYIRKHNFEHNLFESEYEIYAPYSSEEQALQFEKDLRKFKSAEVFRHADIGEIHAYIKVR